MHYKFRPKGVCSSNIEFDIEDGIVRNVKYTGGCNGNTKAIAALVEGESAQRVVERLTGIRCGLKKTSCGDQLAAALKEAIG